MSEKEFSITPSHPSAAAGTVRITLRNDGKLVHALEIENAGPGGKDVSSSDIQPGSTATVVAKLKPGKTYEFYCPIDSHKRLGMKGTITVSAGGSAAAAPATSQSSSSSGDGGSGGSGV